MSLNIGIAADGSVLPYTSDQVKAIMLKAQEEGDILAVILRVDESLAVHVFGAPSREILDCLETTTRAYRRALQGH